MKAIDNIQTKGERLYTIRRLIEDIEKRQEEELKGLKEEKEAISADLIAGFKRIGLTQIKIPSGDTIALATRKGIEVTNEREAMKWCIENRTVSINKILVKAKLEPILSAGKTLPDGFEWKEVEFISVRKPKAKEVAEVSEKKE